MKKILLSISLFITSISLTSAQTDYCNDIKKEVSEHGIFYTSPTPGDSYTKSVISFSFIKFINLKRSSIFLSLAITSEDGSWKKGPVSIKFEDNSELNYVDKKVDKNDEMVIGRYLYSVNIMLDDDALNKFKTKKVKSYTIISNTASPSADNFRNKIKAYANCLDNFTEGPVAKPVEAPIITPQLAKKPIDGFWGIQFGSSMAQVKSAILAKGAKQSMLSNNADMLVFNNVVFTQRRLDLLTTNFVNGKFSQAVVVYPQSEESGVLAQFQIMVDELSTVYGQAREIKSFEGIYKEGDGFEVQAIQLGKANYAARWKSSNGNYILLIIGKDLRIKIYYVNEELDKVNDTKKNSDY